MKLTVLFLGRNGAGPKYAFEMTKALLQQNEVNCQVVIPNNIDNLSEWQNLTIIFQNLEIVTVETYTNKKQFLFSIFNIFLYHKIASIIKNYNPDWIYLPMGSLLNPGVFLFLKNYKKIYTLHDPILHLGEKSYFVEFLRKMEIKQCEKIVLLNTYFINKVSTIYNLKKENIFVIPHAGFFSSEVPNYPDYFLNKVLFIGRIEKYKGIDLLLDTINLVVQEKKDIILTIAGKGDLAPYRKKIDKIRSHIVIKNHWLSEVEMEVLLKENDFVILPYIDASQSGVIPMAYGNGKIVIVTNIGALAEQVPKNLGLCVNAESKDIAHAVNQLYNMPFEKFIEMSKNAYSYAKEELTWQSSADKLIKILS